MFKIAIPKPCHEDWQLMLPTEKGAHCGVCCRNVIDFTMMSDEAVKNYLLNRDPGKLCGRFRNEQVETKMIYLPENILSRKIAGWKKFMAIVILAFSSTLIGCDVLIREVIKGEPLLQTAPDNWLTGDTIYAKNMGMLSPSIEASSKDTTTCNMATKGDDPVVIKAATITVAKLNSNPGRSLIMGKIAYEPVRKKIAGTGSAAHKKSRRHK
ncbi:MAG: hypothetical protein V4717_06630 [Bacteroidota bacterium]